MQLRSGLGNSVNYQRLIVAALLFYSVSLGMASGARAFPIDNEEESTFRRIPYTINTAEIQGAVEILANIGSVRVASSRSLPVIESVTYYIVLNAKGNPIGYDLYIPGLKESVDFKASNSVKAAAFDDPRLVSWPISDKLELYKRLEHDLTFGSLVQQVRNAKGLRPNDEETWQRIRQLTERVAETYAHRKGMD